MSGGGVASNDRPGEATLAPLTTSDGDLLEVRATIHLHGLSLGELALVDPSEPYVADCLRAGYLVSTELEAVGEAPVVGNTAGSGSAASNVGEPERTGASPTVSSSDPPPPTAE